MGDELSGAIQQLIYSIRIVFLVIRLLLDLNDDDINWCRIVGVGREDHGDVRPARVAHAFIIKTYGRAVCTWQKKSAEKNDTVNQYFYYYSSI